MNVFGEHETIVLPSRTIRWVSPESIQSDDEGAEVAALYGADVSAPYITE